MNKYSYYFEFSTGKFDIQQFENGDRPIVTKGDSKVFIEISERLPFIFVNDGTIRCDEIVKIGLTSVDFKQNDKLWDLIILWLRTSKKLKKMYFLCCTHVTPRMWRELYRVLSATTVPDIKLKINGTAFPIRFYYAFLDMAIKHQNGMHFNCWNSYVQECRCTQPCSIIDDSEQIALDDAPVHELCHENESTKPDQKSDSASSASVHESCHENESTKPDQESDSASNISNIRWLHSIWKRLFD